MSKIRKFDAAWSKFESGKPLSEVEYRLTSRNDAGYSVAHLAAALGEDVPEQFWDDRAPDGKSVRDIMEENRKSAASNYKDKMPTRKTHARKRYRKS